MIKCESADRYIAIYPPRCNAGVPCDACRAKWQEQVELRAAYMAEPVRAELLVGIAIDHDLMEHYAAQESATNRIIEEQIMTEQSQITCELLDEIAAEELAADRKPDHIDFETRSKEPL